MSEPAHRFLIAYDVSNDRRRDAVARQLSAVGDRIQYSVFIVDVRPARIVRIRSAVVSTIDLDTDSVLVCDLGPTRAIDATRFDVVGRDRPLTGGPMIA